MSKTRVYEVARELGVKNRELIQKIASLGIQVRNHMSVLEPAEVERVKRALEKEKSVNTVEERIRPTVVRRRTVSRRKQQPKPAEKEEQPSAQPAAETKSAQPAAESPAESEPQPSREPAPAAPEPQQPQAPRPEPQAERPAAAEQPAAEPQAPERPASEPQQPSQAPQPAAAAASASPSEPASQPVEPQQPQQQPQPQQQQQAAAAAAQAAPEQSEPAQEQGGGSRGSEPPPASVRLAHANLPPGVVARGKTVAPGAAPLPESARNRIVTEHQQQRKRPETPRRRELGRAALGPTGRPAGRMGRPGKKKMAPGKKGKQTEITVPSAQKRVIRIEGEIQLQVLAQRMSLKATEVLMKLMQMGMSGVHINSTLDPDTAKILASEFGYEVENVARSEEEVIGDARGEFEDHPEDRVVRAPIVTVMGHVDHGKTSLLDRIRKADVVAGEAGGITQHIGAYRVETDEGGVVFLDTPGHEAFTSMRARGAQATDVVVLVVAADDGVMPQTKEAISHAKDANVQIVVALNKVDREDAQPERVKTELAADGLQPEEWGGDTIFVECSAATGMGVDKLLENIVLQSEMLELKANPRIPAKGIVLEAYLDKGRGPVANVLVSDGTLHTGDYVVAGSAWGRVRAMTDERGKQAKEAGPATPVEVLGLSEVPSAGDILYKVTGQKKAQQVAEAQQKPAEKPAAPAARGLDQLQQLMQSGEVRELKLVVKADVQGSVEALEKSLNELSGDKVRVHVIHTGVGGITDNDVLLASASNAIIIGFNVRPQGQASSTAKKENIEIRTYSVIYEALDDIKQAMAGLLEPKIVERDRGKAEVRQTFSIPKVGTIAGSYVTEGKILRNGKARLVRDGVQLWQGPVASLKRFKEDAREVSNGYECGIGLQGYNDVKEGDIIESFEEEEVRPEL